MVKISKRIRSHCKILYWDVVNRIRFGRDCPRRFELRWCLPEDIQLATKYYSKVPAKYLIDGSDLDIRSIELIRNRFIDGGDWDRDVVNINNCSIIQRCEARYSRGLSWLEVGEHSWMGTNISENGVQDGCHNLADIESRCASLDLLYQYICTGGQFKSQRELRDFAFRERGGIGVAVSREGKLIWMDGGAHRLAISKILGVGKIPVSLVLVHKDAVINGRLNDYLY